MARRFRNAIGPNVRRLRIERGWTQEQLAARLQLAGLHSLDRVGVAKIESQLRSAYDYEVAIIAEVLAVDPGQLMPPSDQLTEQLDALIAGRRE